METRNSGTDRQAFTLIEALVATAIIGVLAGLLLAAVQQVRQAAARLQCQNRLKQLALGLHHFHDTANKLPPGHRSLLNRDLMPFSGWPVSILPYVEQQALSDRASATFRVFPFAFANPPHTGLDTVVPAFICPSDDRVVVAQVSKRTNKPVAFTSYLGVSGDNFKSPNGVLYQDSRVSLMDISDGTSNTLLLGERPPSADFQFGWWYAGIGQRLTGSADMILSVREPNLQPIVSGSKCGPGNYPFMPANGFDDPCGMFHFWSPHSGGANFALCDGSVRFLHYSADPIMPALATRAGAESVNVPQ